jgi:hypothetical protein
VKTKRRVRKKAPKAPPAPERPKGKPGARQLDNPTTRQLLLDALFLGKNRTEACGRAGVSLASLERYEKHPENAEFADLVRNAKVERWMRLKAYVERHAKTKWQAAAWLLAHEFPKEFGRKLALRATDEDEAGKKRTYTVEITGEEGPGGE